MELMLLRFDLSPKARLSQHLHSLILVEEIKSYNTPVFVIRQTP